MKEASTTIMYASDMLRETVTIALEAATLNDLEVELGDILNVYVHAAVTEKGETILGSELCKDICKSEVLENYMAYIQHEQHLEVTSPNAQNPLGISVVGLIWICG